MCFPFAAGVDVCVYLCLFMAMISCVDEEMCDYIENPVEHKAKLNLNVKSTKWKNKYLRKMEIGSEKFHFLRTFEKQILMWMTPFINSISYAVRLLLLCEYVLTSYILFLYLYKLMHLARQWLRGFTILFRPRLFSLSNRRNFCPIKPSKFLACQISYID